MATWGDDVLATESPPFAGRFRLQRQLGSGGMADVYLSFDEETQTPCAIKLLSQHSDPEQRQRFFREASVLSQLQHPGIVRYHAHGYTEQGVPYLAMELLEGEDLCQRLLRKPLTAAETLVLAQAVLSALTAAHQAGIIHRDIKPANLFLVSGEPARTKLLDFGIVRLTTASQHTRTGSILGTPEYMSPEQLRGLKELDARSDLFSLGVVLYECLAGWSPFRSDHPMGTLGRILFDDPPKLSERNPNLPEALCVLVHEMLAKEPRHRPPSAEAVRTRLQNISVDSDGDRITGWRAPAALTHRELRWLSMIIFQPTRIDLALEKTSILEAGELDQDAIGQTAAAHSARREKLADGTQILLLDGNATAGEQAEQAALCAIELHSHDPHTAIAICFGQTDLGQHRLDAQALERAADMLDAWRKRTAAASTQKERSSAPILVDESLRRMLMSRFEFVEQDSAWELTPTERRDELHVLGRVSPFAGRDTELTQLATALSACCEDSQAAAVLITAEPGMGKSRLCHEFLRQAKLSYPDLEVWIGAGDPSSAGSPFHLIAQAIRQAMGVQKSMTQTEKTERLRSFVSGRCNTADHERIGEFLGELLGITYQQTPSVTLQSARSNPVLMGDQIRFAFLDLLRASMADHPLLLLLEDLHWGDLPTVQLVEAALRNHSESPLFLLALARPQVDDLFPKLWDRARLLKLPLRPLSKRACEKIAKGILGNRFGADKLTKLAERAGGHPFFLEELLRATSESDTFELPESVLAMVQSRILRLDSMARRVLRAASVFGRVFHRGGLTKMLGIDHSVGSSESEQKSLRDALSTLVDREFVNPRHPSRFAGEDEFVFSHALVQESAYSMLTAEDRQLGHRLAAEFLQAVGEDDAMVLAEHCTLGGVLDQAVMYLRQVVSEALTGNDFRAALSCTARALKLGAEGTVRGTLLAMEAEAHQWLGEFRAAIDSAEEALHLLPVGSVPWYRAVDALSIGCGRLLLHDRLSELAVQLLALLHHQTESEHFSLPVLASSAVRLGMQLYICGRYKDALALLQPIEALIDADPNPKPPALLASICVLRANRAAYEWKIDLCPDYFEQSANLLDQIGDRRAACSQRLDTALFCSDIGDFVRMERLLREVIPVALTLNLLRVLGVSFSALGVARWRQGHHEEALTHCQKALAQLESLGDARQEGVCRINLARILYSLGQFEKAHAAALTASERLAEIPRFRVRALAWLARIEQQRGNLDAAALAAETSLGQLRALGRAGTDEGLVYHTVANIKLAIGQNETAKALLAEGRTRLLRQAAAITRSEARNDFLYKLTENAELLALAAAHCPEPIPS